MKGKHFLGVFVFIAVALVCQGASAQMVAIIPGVSQFAEGNSNNSIPYNATFFANVAYNQVHAPAEFCVLPPDVMNPGPYPSAGDQGAVAPFMLGSLSVHCDGVFGADASTSTRPDAGTIHRLTDIAPLDPNFIGFNIAMYTNGTTVSYPGGFSLTCPTPFDPARPGARLPQKITSIAGGFTYPGFGGACPSPIAGGLSIQVQVTSGTLSGSSTLFFDADQKNPFQSAGLYYNVTRYWGTGGGATGAVVSGTHFYGIVYALEIGGCATYQELKDEVLNADISGNPPSDPVVNPPSGIGGIRNSLWKKVINSEAAFNRGSNSAGNTLEAFINECEAQSGKHVSEDSAKDMINCCRGVIGSLGL